MSGASQFSVFFDDDRRRRILRSLFEAYYADVPCDGVTFDTNRIWTGRTAMLADLFPTCRIVCCVREIGWILDSIECALRKNPLQLSRLFNYEPGKSVYARAETLMDADTGLVGQPWSCLREAWFSQNAERLIVIDYRRLVDDPQSVMRKLYEALDEPHFAHDFDNVSYDQPDYDTALGMPGMHQVSGRVAYREREPRIPPDLFAKHEDLSFWTNPGLDRNSVKVL